MYNVNNLILPLELDMKNKKLSKANSKQIKILFIIIFSKKNRDKITFTEVYFLKRYALEKPLKKKIPKKLSLTLQHEKFDLFSVLCKILATTKSI